MFFFLSKLLDIFLSPLVWSLILAALAIPWRRRHARTWKRRRIFGACSIFVTLFFSSNLVAGALLRSLEDRAVSTYRDDVTYDAVVLLGGIGDEYVWQQRGQPSLNDNVERLVVTNRLLHEGRAKVAIVSGGTTEPTNATFGEAHMLAWHLREWGIPDDRILIEDQAKNTRENALLSAAIIREHGFRRVLVVTSAYHVPRAADCFRAVELDVDFLPVDYRTERGDLHFSEFLPRAGALQESTTVLREIFGRIVYRVRGYGKGA